MEELLIKLLMNGGPSGVIVGVGFFFIRMQITALRNDVQGLESGKRWTETCDARHREVDHRLDRLEAVANGALRR